MCHNFFFCISFLCQQQYNQQQMYAAQSQQNHQSQQNMQQIPQPPMPPPQSQAQNRNGGGPIYVPSNVSKVNQAAAAAAAAMGDTMPPQPPNMFPQNVQGPPQPPPISYGPPNGSGNASGGYGSSAQYGAQIVSRLFFMSFSFLKKIIESEEPGRSKIAPILFFKKGFITIFYPVLRNQLQCPSFLSSLLRKHQFRT